MGGWINGKDIKTNSIYVRNTHFKEKNMEVDPESGLTDQQKYRNYLTLIKTIDYIESGQRITEDWMIDNKNEILKYREWIKDYSKVNDDVENQDFRKICEDTEDTIQYLCKSIEKTNTFDTAVYVTLLRLIKEICDFLFTDEEIDGLMKMMSL